MGGLSCNCIKRDSNIIVLSDLLDNENTANPGKINPIILHKIIKIQAKWKSCFLRTNQTIKAKAKSRALFNSFNLFKIRPELKEIVSEEFTPQISEKVKEILQNMGSFILTQEEADLVNSAEQRNLIQMNPVLMDNNLIYIGTWNLEAKREGYGIMYLPGGGKFEGFFNNDQKNGRGRLINHEGDLYEGDFVNDKANGYGKYVSPGNVVYKGHWKDDNQHGTGEEEYPDNSRYKGEFLKGCKHGKGKFVWPDGSEYEGDFFSNNLQGKGTYRWIDGRVYSGNWVNTKMDGFGEFTWPDNKKYVGNYKMDKKSGYGVFYWPNGKKYEGGWFNGKQHGHGIMTIGEMRKFGEWRLGKRLRWIEDNENNYTKIIDEIKNKIERNEKENAATSNYFSESANENNLNGINQNFNSNNFVVEDEKVQIKKGQIF